MRELRKPDTAGGWWLLAAVGLAARVGWVFLSDHLGGAAGGLPPTPTAVDIPAPAAPPSFLTPTPAHAQHHHHPQRHHHRGDPVPDRSKNRANRTLTIATCNDDWATAGTNIGEVKGCDVVFIQEGKRAHYRQLLGPEHVVRQSWLNLGRAGSVIVIRKDSGLKLGGYGWTFGVAAAGLLPRWIAWQRANLGGARLLLEAAHRPPQRVSRFWAPFDWAFAARARRAFRAHRLVIAGLDANQADPEALARSSGLLWHSTDPKRIDGFLASRGVKFLEIRALPKGTSNHQPLVADVELHPGKREWVGTTRGWVE